MADLTVNAGEACFCSKDKATNGRQGGLCLLFALGKFSQAPDRLCTTRRYLQRVLHLLCRSVSWEIEAEAPCGDSGCLGSGRGLKRPRLFHSGAHCDCCLLNSCLSEGRVGSIMVYIVVCLAALQRPASRYQGNPDSNSSSDSAPPLAPIIYSSACIFFHASKGAPFASPPLIPTCPQAPPLRIRASPLSVATAINRVMSGWGGMPLTPTPWPSGDWILDKVLRQTCELGRAASAEQIPVLLGWLRQSHPKGRRLSVESM